MAVDRRQQFVQKLYPYAREFEKRTGIPATWAVAMAANETGWDASNPVLFGIKGKSPSGNSGNFATWEVYGGKRQDINDEFATYNDPSEAFAHLAQEMGTQRYKGAPRTNATDFAAYLQKQGWATDPTYAQKIGTLAGQVQGMVQGGGGGTAGGGQAAPAREANVADTPLAGDPWGEEPSVTPTKVVRNGQIEWVDSKTGKTLWVQGPPDKQIEPVRTQLADGAIIWKDKNTGEQLWIERPYDPALDPRAKNEKPPAPETRPFPDGSLRQYNPQTGKWDVIGSPEQEKPKPSPLQILWDSTYQMIDQIQQDIASGKRTPAEGNAYIQQMKAYLQASLRGTTPFAEEQAAKEEARQNRAQGESVLNQRLASGNSMAQALMSGLLGAYGKMLPNKGAPPMADPLALARAFTTEMGGGQDVSDFAKQLLMGAFSGNGSVPGGPGAGADLSGLGGQMPSTIAGGNVGAPYEFPTRADSIVPTPQELPGAYPEIYGRRSRVRPV